MCLFNVINAAEAAMHGFVGSRMTARSWRRTSCACFVLRNSEYNIEYAIIHLRLTEFGIRYKIRVFCKRYKNTSKYVKIRQNTSKYTVF